jgi:hypothetical protein
MKLNSATAPLLCLSLIAFGSCARAPAYRSPDAAVADGGACEEIASSCHEHDSESGLAHECHLLGHDGSQQQCQARRSVCWNECHSALRGAPDVGLK